MHIYIHTHTHTHTHTLHEKYTSDQNTEFRVCIQILSLCLYQCVILCTESDNCVFLIKLFMYDTNPVVLTGTYLANYFETSHI